MCVPYYSNCHQTPLHCIGMIIYKIWKGEPFECLYKCLIKLSVLFWATPFYLFAVIILWLTLYFMDFYAGYRELHTIYGTETSQFAFPIHVDI